MVLCLHLCLESSTFAWLAIPFKISPKIPVEGHFPCLYNRATTAGVAELADAQDLGFRVSRVSNLLTDTQQSTAFIRDGISLVHILALLCSFFLIVGLQISER